MTIAQLLQSCRNFGAFRLKFGQGLLCLLNAIFDITMGFRLLTNALVEIRNYLLTLYSCRNVNVMRLMIDNFVRIRWRLRDITFISVVAETHY